MMDENFKLQMMMMSMGKRPVLVELDIVIQEEGILYDQSVLRMRANSHPIHLYYRIQVIGIM